MSSDYKGYQISENHNDRDRGLIETVIDTISDRDRNQPADQNGLGTVWSMLSTFFGLQMFSGLTEASGGLFSAFQSGELAEIGSMPNGGALDGFMADMQRAAAPTMAPAPQVTQAPGIATPRA